MRLQQKLKLSRVKPYPLTASTIIKLNIVILDNYHIVLTYRAYHNFQTLSGIVSSVYASGSGVKMAFVEASYDTYEATYETSNRERQPLHPFVA